LLDSGETGGLDSREWTLGESLRKAGYETAFVGAWHLGDTPGCTATNQGFQLFYGLPYRPDAVPAPPLVENTTIVDAVHNPSNLLAQLTARATTYIGAQGGPDPFLLVFQPPSLPATGTSLQGTYGNRVEALDSSIGELLDALESAGLTSNTLVVFCSDEGPDLTSATAPFGSAGIFMDGKTTTWEGGVRVPFIASWPGVIAPATDSYGVLWMPDLFSTLVDIADGHTPGDRPYDGTSRPLLLLAKQTQPDDETTIYLHRHNGTGYELQVVRKGAYKYHAAYQNSDPQNTFSTAAPLLFQLELDPIEYYNKASSLPSKVTELQVEAASYEATFVPAQLPPAKGPFIIAPELVVGDDGVGNPAFNSTIIRPRDSLNDHYHIQHCTNLVLSGWNNLPIEDYILSIIPQPVEEEVLEISVPFDDPEFSGPNNFIRILGERP
jgi:arylsulfatase A-like enzyme